MRVREATVDDAAACLAIYEPYVSGSAITFEIEPPSERALQQRIGAMSRSHGWLVLEDCGRVVGYAYGSPFKERPAYRWTCEVTVYVEMGRRRSGAGLALYETLLPHLNARGYLTAAAAITLPNAASEGLHRRLGFETVGVFRRVGYKNGCWHDVMWMQRSLGAASEPPAEPR